MKVIIQIPCYNEADTLKITLDKLPKVLEGVDSIEYLIINDGSSDATVDIAREWGVNYIVNMKQNKGLAMGFMAGLDAGLHNGADIIVNTDADNQYCADDIQELIRPILSGQYDIVIGARPIDEIKEFSFLKKKLQKMGSWVVRKLSNSNIPDAPSGFRAYSRAAAMEIAVINEYTYTLETIIQAGTNRMAMTSIPIHTNPELRKSRLFNSMSNYVKRAALTIIRAFMLYKPLKFFTVLGAIPMLGGVVLGIRFLFFYCTGSGNGHIQSLILSAILLMLGWQTVVTGLQADIISANRKLLQDMLKRIKKLEYGEKNI